MTNPTKLEELTKKIQELVPEIMELKFGCKFKYEKKAYVFTSSTGMMTDIHQGCHSIFIAKRLGCADFDDYIRINVEYEIEILGRAIQLADVLLAIDKKYHGDQFATVASNGWFHLNSQRCFWDFTKPLHLQSPETIDFLHSILC